MVLLEIENRIDNIKKFKDELIRQGMNDLNVQLRLIQPKDKKIITLYLGTVGAPSNPSSYSEKFVGPYLVPLHSCVFMEVILRVEKGDDLGIF